MKDDKNFFDVSPPEQHTDRVEMAVEKLLGENRLKERRKWLAWIAAPAFASIGGLFLWFKQQQTPESFSAEQAMLLQIDDEEDLEMVADMEMLEDLDFLEEWDGSIEG